MSDLVPDFLIDAPSDRGAVKSPLTLVLAHGAGAPMDSLFMTTFAAAFSSNGIKVARFEFSYMTGRRKDRKKRGVVCIGYLFHPPGKPEKLRTKHLKTLATSSLIVQGTRDLSGTAEQAAAYGLSTTIRFLCLEDGNHDFKPRRKSGRTQDQNWD